MVFYWERLSTVMCRVGFVVGDDHDGHLFWECTFPPLVEIRENPEFHELMEMDKSFWPRCLLWHGWLPLLSGANLGSPWAQDLSQGAGHLYWRALWVLTPLLLYLIGVCLLVLMLRLLLFRLLRNLMFGLMWESD